MFEKIIEIIKNNDSIVLFGHSFPDGDCYGSLIGLRESLRITFPNKKIYAVGSGFIRFAKRLGVMDSISDDVIRGSLAIILDANDLSRVEDSRVYLAKSFIKLDHHVENYKFVEGEFVVNTSANSTCEIILDLIREANYKYNKVVCEALYLGILTDSGRFQFVTNFPKAYNDAAWLCENGADSVYITKLINKTNEYALKFKAFVYSHYKKTNSGVIYLKLSKKELQKFSLSSDKGASMVNLLSNVNGYPIWAFFCENETKNEFKVELRSSGPIIQPIATKYGGGGHLHACGMTIKDLNEELLESILSDLGECAKRESES